MARIVRKKPFVRRRPCQFCLDRQNPIDYIDYKDDLLLSKMVNMQGKILSSRITGTCAKHQRAVALAVKRARYVAILPYIGSIKREKVDNAQDNVAKREIKVENKEENVEIKANSEESKPRKTTKKVTKEVK